MTLHNTPISEQQPHISSTQWASLAIWTKKFATPFARLRETHLQKINATDKGELILNVYKPGDDKSRVVLSMKKGESGIFTTHTPPLTQSKPNSIVQIARKYLLGRKIKYTYATVSPICIVLVFEDPSESIQPIEYIKEIQEGPNAIVLDLDEKPPRLIVARVASHIPARYEIQYQKSFAYGEDFFESFCEWSEEGTKTKRRASFESPLQSYCPLPEKQGVSEGEKEDVSLPTPAQHPLSATEISANSPSTRPHLDHKSSPVEHDELLTLTAALALFPSHIRRVVRTKLQFLERRLGRQRSDLPSLQEIDRLERQSEGLKALLYLWPEHTLTWYVPPQYIEQYSLNMVYTLKKGETKGVVLEKIYRERDILKRRLQELTLRLAQGAQEKERFENDIVQSAQEIKKTLQEYELQHAKPCAPRDVVPLLTRRELPTLARLCKQLHVSLKEEGVLQKIHASQKSIRLPYRTYVTPSGHVIRVARSAADGDTMIRHMPSHHVWCHVLHGEGSHVWLELAKGEKEATKEALREAAILAVYHSKQNRAAQAEVQTTKRAHLEKKKNLPPGKVLVRRASSFIVKYESAELQSLLAGLIKNESST